MGPSTLGRQQRPLQQPQNNCSVTQLHECCHNRQLAEVKQLLEKGASVSSGQGSTIGTPLHVAAAQGYPDVTEALLRAGADPNLVCASGSTPLHDACASGLNPDVVQLLLESGADPSARNKELQTPLLLVVQQACTGVHSTNNNSNNSSSGSCNIQAILTIVKLLLEAGANPTVASVRGFSALGMAITSSTSNPDDGEDDSATSRSSRSTDSMAVLQLLVASQLGAAAAPRAMWQACWEGVFADDKAAVARILHMRGLKDTINTPWEDGYMLLHSVVLHNWPDLVEQLLQQGAAVGPRLPETRDTPLDLAVYHGYKKTAEKLLAAGANPFLSVGYGHTPFRHAAEHGNLKLVQMMLAAAQQQGHAELIDQLTDDVGVTNTALHQAACKGHLEVVKALVVAGASCTIQDSNGDTALQALCREWSRGRSIKSTNKAAILVLLSTPTALQDSIGGQHLMQEAIRWQKSELAAALLAAGVHSLAPHTHGGTLLEAAAQRYAATGDGRWMEVVMSMLLQALPAYTPQRQQQEPAQASEQQQGPVGGQQAAATTYHPVVRAIYAMSGGAGAGGLALQVCLTAAVSILSSVRMLGLWADLLAHHAALPGDKQVLGVDLVEALVQGCLEACKPGLQKRAAILQRLQQLVPVPQAHGAQDAAALAESAMEAVRADDMAKCLRLMEQVFCMGEYEVAAALRGLEFSVLAGQKGPGVSPRAAALCKAVLAAWPEGGRAPPLHPTLAHAVVSAVQVCCKRAQTGRA